jgi:hypothetical protein
MFKIKDLMIKVLPTTDPPGRPCGNANTNCTQCTDWTGWGCDMGTFCACSTGGCTACTQNCTMVTCGLTPTGCGTYLSGMVGPHLLGGLGELKEALRQQLAAIEAQEKRVDQALQPRTLAEVEALEKKLTEALQELQELKKTLG